MVEKEINLKNLWFCHKFWNFWSRFLESVKLSVSSKRASQCSQHLHFRHKLVGLQNCTHYFIIAGRLMKSWAQGLPGHRIWSACNSKVMIYDQPQSSAGCLPCLNTQAKSPCRAQLPSTSSMSCWRGPRRPLPHSYGYEPPFLELPVHSIFQRADAGLALEKNGYEEKNSKEGWLFLD